MRLAIGAVSAVLACAALDPATAACTIGKMAELPVTMSGLRPIISTKINGAEAQFMADSGAFWSVITPGNATAFNLPLGPPPFDLRMTGIGGDTSTMVATVREFTFGGVPLRNVQFIVGGSEVGQVGVIGQNVWGIGDVEYDLPHGAIRMMRPEGCAKSNLAYWAGAKPYSIVEIEDRAASRMHTVGTVTIDNVRVHAMFDTGAGRSILSLATAARMGIKPDSPGVVPAGEIAGFGRKMVRVWNAPIDSFKTDGEEIAHLHLLIGELPPDTEMLIGADFFIAHRVYVSNSLRKLFFTYEGGPVFNTRTDYRDGSTGSEAKAVAIETSGPGPSDADGFSRRGAVYLAQRDFPHAIADFTHAITMAPGDPHYLYQRAQAYFESGQRTAARADLDQVLKLKPGDLDALLARAEMRAVGEDRAGAATDLAAAAAVAPGSANERFRIAGLYNGIDKPDLAIAQYDLWIAAHPDDSRRPMALNGRCWSRALLGRDLKQALGDCDAALRARPKQAAFLDSRGLVHLRLGDYEAAVGDYDASLATMPHNAWSLYGRGLAKTHAGRAAEGKADIDAATALDAKVVERAKGYGITP